MARDYLPADRDQEMLLPPSVRDWLPAGHLAVFLVDAVEQIDTSMFHQSRRTGGVGRRGYDPDVLLTLLIYAYCTGQRSSRAIERLCEVDLAYRFITANRAPDHATICRFVADNETHMVELFVQVLRLCGQAGLLSVGLVAVDGTKVAANASGAATLERERIAAELDRLRGQVSDIVADAQAVDAEQDELFGPDRRGDEMPTELHDRSSRKSRLEEAMAQIDAAHDAWQRQRAAAKGSTEKVARTREKVTRTRRRRDRRKAKEAAAQAAHGGKLPGSVPDVDTPVATAEAELATAEQDLATAEQARRDAAERGEKLPEQVPATPPMAARKGNVTDPDSRLMPTQRGFVQGFNCQAAVNAGQIVLGGRISQNQSDATEAVPMMTEVADMLAQAGLSEPVGVVLFDAGYHSEDNLTADGPDRLICDQAARKQRAAARERGDSDDPPPPADGAGAIAHNAWRLATADGAALYKLRSQTIEPTFGQIKEHQRLRRFRRRGLSAVSGEWHLVTACHNLLKIYRQSPATS